MVIDNCKKVDFQVFKEISENKIDISWGYEDRVEKVGKLNEETGKWELTGEVKETDYCTFEHHEFEGKRPTMRDLDKMFAKSQRLPKVKELRAIGTALGFTEEQVLPWAKKHLLNTIAKYDKSKNVEDFSINGIHMWLNPELRGKVKENLEYCQTMGIENTTLRHEGMAFPMTVQMGWQLYYAVLGYARDTWDVTQVHEASVPNVETLDALEEYEANFPSAYPAKLAF